MRAWGQGSHKIKTGQDRIKSKLVHHLDQILKLGRSCHECRGKVLCGTYFQQTLTLQPQFLQFSFRISPSRLEPEGIGDTSAQCCRLLAAAGLCEGPYHWQLAFLSQHSSVMKGQVLLTTFVHWKSNSLKATLATDGPLLAYSLHFALMWYSTVQLHHKLLFVTNTMTW